MLNKTNIHTKLINKLPTLNKEDISNIKRLSSYDDAVLLPNKEIIDLSAYELEYNESTYKFDLPSNQSNDIFFFDENTMTKHYHKIKNFKYYIKKEYQQQLQYYEFSLEYKTTDTLKIDFFILEYENNVITNIIQMENDMNEFQTLENTEYFMVCLKLSGKGFMYNLYPRINKKKRQILNNLLIQFNENDFYNTSKEIDIKQDNDSVNIIVNKNDKKHIYISFSEMNNKFSLLPYKDIFKELSYKNDLLANLNLTKDETLEVIPMLIEYNSKNKTNIKNLSFLNQEIISLKKDTENLRFVLRVSGVGEINLKSLELIELERAPIKKTMDFKNRKDVLSLMTPQMKLYEFKVACIMDEFTYNSFKPEVKLYKITPEKWKSEIFFIQPDLLFIESAWFGNDGIWNKKVAYYDEEQHIEIKSLITFAQDLDIPVVFWNKEDPVHYDRFIETAKLCDYVFTTDKGRIPQYMKDCGHANINALPFAAQPQNHNPIKIQAERDPRVSFAGSYYRHHEERSKDMDLLLEASKDIGLVIYDRNYEKTSKGQMPNHVYPEKYWKYIKGSLPFNLIDKSYKGYKYMINVNTVKHSETMFSRRVFEGLISGTPIISTYSLGMKLMFGDIIESSNNIKDLKEHLNKLNSSDLVYNKYVVKGIREILVNHTYEHRMKSVLNAVGYSVRSNKTNVFFIAFIESNEEVKAYIEIFNRQTVINKKLVLVHKNIVNYKEFYNNFNTRDIMGIDYNVLKKYINISQLLGIGYISVINSNHYYSDNYALDLIVAKKYSAADIIGKAMYYSVRNENEMVLEGKSKDYIYTSELVADRSVINVKVFDKFTVANTLEYLEGNLALSNLIPFGAKTFSADSLNFIQNGGDYINKEIIDA